MSASLLKKIANYLLRFSRKVIFDVRFPAFLQFPIFRFVYYRRGIAIYKKLRKQYGDCTICVCPYKGTGDVYLAAAYFKDSENDKKENVFCVVGASNKKIAELFHFNARILQYSVKQIDSLTRFSFFVDLEKMNIKILHHDPLSWHGGINDRFRNINSLIFTDLIGYGAFGVENPMQLSKPVFLDKDEETERLFSEDGFKKGKTVLIAPFSYTLAVLPEWFWKKLVIELKNMGYSVCTNLGSKEKKAIDGTEGVFLRYEQLGVFLRNAGYFIGIRSGFCDVISSIPCKKIILYQPYLFWGEGENMDYFSLNKMGLCSDAIELQHRGVEFIDLVKNITRLLEEKKNG